MAAYKKSLVPILDVLFFPDTNISEEMDLIFEEPKALSAHLLYLVSICQLLIRRHLVCQIVLYVLFVVNLFKGTHLTPH